MYTTGSVRTPSGYGLAHSGAYADPMSEARRGAIEVLRPRLKLNVNVKAGLEDRLHQVTGGFMNYEELQAVSEERAPSAKVDKILSILLGKGDKEFDIFLKLLEETNQIAWAQELRQQVRVQGEAGATGSTAARRQVTAMEVVERPAPSRTDTQPEVTELRAEVARLKNEIETLHSRLQRYVASESELDQEVDRQDGVIRDLNASIAQKDRQIVQQDRQIVQQDRKITRLEQTIARLERTGVQGAARLERTGVQGAAGRGQEVPPPTGPGAESCRLIEQARELLDSLAQNESIEFRGGLSHIFIRHRGNLKTRDTQLRQHSDLVADHLAALGLLDEVQHQSCREGSASERIDHIIQILGSRIVPHNDHDSRQSNRQLFADLLEALGRADCAGALSFLLEGFRSVQSGDLPRRRR